MLKHILIASDGSGGAEKAARVAATLARCCSAKLTAITVHSEDALLLPAMTSALLPGSVSYTPFPKKEAKKHIEAHASSDIFSKVENAVGELAQDLGKVQFWGHAAEQICQFAEQNQVDMIVIGSRGHSQFSKMLLGSTSSQVVIMAPCSVTVAR